MMTNAYSIAISSFPTKRLGKLCDIVSGISAPQNKEAFEKGTIHFVRMKDLGRYHLTRNLNKTDDCLNKEFVNKNNIKTCSKGTIIFPRSGSVHLNHRAILGVDAVIVNHLGGLIVKSKEIIPEFLYWILTQYDMRQIMSQTTGLNMIRFSDVENIKIPIPPKVIQQKISNLLNTAEETLNLRAEANILTENIILSNYHKLFGSPYNNDKNFKVVKLGEAATLQMGGTPSTKKREYYENGNIYWMKSGDIKGDFIYDIPNKITSEGLKNSNAKMYKKNSVVIALNGQGKTRGSTAILRLDTSSNQSVVEIRPKENILLSEYLHFHLKQRYNEIRNLTGDNQRSGLNLKILRNFEIILPPINFQKEFSEIARKLENIMVWQASSEPIINKLAYTVIERAFSKK